MTGFSSTLTRCFLVSLCLLVVSSAPTADQTFIHSVRSTTETGPTTTEELDFKDVPIYEKEKLQKPPPGFKYVPVLKCNNETDEEASTPSSDQSAHDEDHSSESASLLEVAHDPVQPSVNGQSQVANQAEHEDARTVFPPDNIEMEDVNTEESIVSSADDEIVTKANEEAEGNIPSFIPIDPLAVVGEPTESSQIAEENAEQEAPLAISTEVLGEIETGPSGAGFNLDNDGDGSTDVAQAQPELDGGVNTIAVSDPKDDSVETDVLEVADLLSQVEAADPNAVTSMDSNQVPPLPTEVGHFDVGASIGLDSVTLQYDAVDETFQTNGATDVPDDTVKNYAGYQVYRVTIPTEEAARWILKFEDVPGIEFWSDTKLLLQPRGIFVTSATDILVAPDVASYMEEALRQARLPFEIFIKDVQDAIQNENPPKSDDEDELMSRNGHTLTWERYHPLEDIYSYLDYLKLTFPDFVSVTEIGRTTEGRAIQAVRLHQKGGRKAKKAVLIDAGIHAREWIAPSTLTYMIRQIVDNPQKYDCIMNQFDWIFVPVLNPDGYSYTHSHNRMWRKTRSKMENIVFRQTAEASLTADRITRFDDDPLLDDAILEKLRATVAKPRARLPCTGADANRNFGYHWLSGGSSRNPCSDTFAGSKAFSEPESRALRDLVLDHQDQLAMYVSLHAYSQMWLLPWGYKREKPEDFSDLYSLAKIGTAALEKVNGVNYLIGSIPDLLYIASGSSVDWVKGAVGVKYAYTLELRDSGRYGFLLPAHQIIPSGEETWMAVYTAVHELAKRTYDDFASCPSITNEGL